MALAEDIGAGDVTVAAFVPPSARANAVILAKADGVLAGMDVVRAVFAKVDPTIGVTSLAEDGDALTYGKKVIALTGPAGSILTAERTALNFLQRLSGIATATRAYVRAVEGTDTKILDTRKTTPGLRFLEKAAVKAGGGTNHRHGLYDMVMVKDNHLPQAAGAGELQAGIDRAKAMRPGIRIELEADTLEQVESFLTLRGVDVILLDNMSLENMAAAVRMCRPHGVKLEASGNITIERLRHIAETGVDFISSGALTHSVKALDLSLDFEGTPA